MQTQKAWSITYQNGKTSTFKTPSLDETIATWRENTKEIDVRPRGEVVEEEEESETEGSGAPAVVEDKEEEAEA